MEKFEFIKIKKLCSLKKFYNNERTSHTLEKYFQRIYAMKTYERI